MSSLIGYTTIDLYHVVMAVLGVFVLVTLASARITRLFVSDKLFEGWRRCIVNKHGTDSLVAYWAHCSWCLGMPVAFVGAVIWALPFVPWEHWWLIGPATFAISYLIGLLNRLEG